MGCGNRIVKTKKPEGAKETQTSMTLNVELPSPLRGLFNFLIFTPASCDVGYILSPLTGLVIFLFIYKAIASCSNRVEVHRVVEVVIEFVEIPQAALKRERQALYVNRINHQIHVV